MGIYNSINEAFERRYGLKETKPIKKLNEAKDTKASKNKGTSIMKVLLDNKKAIWTAMGEDWKKARDLILELLNAPELKDNTKVAEAKEVFKNIKSESKFASLVTTYMTGMSITKNEDLNITDAGKKAFKKNVKNGLKAGEVKVKKAVKESLTPYEKSGNKWYEDEDHEIVKVVTKSGEEFKIGDKIKNFPITDFDPNSNSATIQNKSYSLDELEKLKESVEDYKNALGKDVEKYQDWVDYDMKRYGKISDTTKKALDKAGLQIIKSQYGQYEVAAKSVNEAKLPTDDREGNLGDAMDKYQQWVDYDMKRYHKISDITKKELDKAGLEVIKDDHGDYEVIAKDKKALGESRKLRERYYYINNNLSEKKAFWQSMRDAGASEKQLMAAQKGDLVTIDGAKYHILDKALPGTEFREGLKNN